MWGYKSPSTSVPGAASHVIIVAVAAAALPRRRSPGVDPQVRVRRKLVGALLQGRQPAARHAEHPQLRRRPQCRRHAAVSFDTTVSARQLSCTMCYMCPTARCKIASTSLNAFWRRRVTGGQAEHKHEGLQIVGFAGGPAAHVPSCLQQRGSPAQETAGRRCSPVTVGRRCCSAGAAAVQCIYSEEQHAAVDHNTGATTTSMKSKCDGARAWQSSTRCRPAPGER